MAYLPFLTIHTLLLALLSFLPSAIWLLYYLGKDDNPEPKLIIVQLFLVGFVLPFFLGDLEHAAQGWLGAYGVSSLTFSFLLLAAFIEEGAKYLAALTIYYRNKEFDEPVDAMIYLIVTALGFAAAENLLYALVAINSDPSQNILLLIIFRFLGATLLHTLTSGIIGYFIARAHFLNESFGVIRGLIWATLVHALFNFFVLGIKKESALQFLFLVILLLIGGSIIVMKDFKKLKQYGDSDLTQL